MATIHFQNRLWLTFRAGLFLLRVLYMFNCVDMSHYDVRFGVFWLFLDIITKNNAHTTTKGQLQDACCIKVGTSANFSSFSLFHLRLLIAFAKWLVQKRTFARNNSLAQDRRIEYRAATPGNGTSTPAFLVSSCDVMHSLYTAYKLKS